MASPISADAVDGVLVQWGDRLFYPRNRIIPVGTTPRLTALMRHQADGVRRRNRGDRDAAGAVGQGDGRWSGHGRHRRALPLHQQGGAAGLRG